MALFDLVNFNGEVFDAAVRETPNLRLNELLHCGDRSGVSSLNVRI